MAARSIRLIAAALLGILAVTVPISGERPQPAAASALAGSVTPLDQRIRFTAAPGASILVQGTYPKVSNDCVDPVQPLLHARFPGTIEVGVDTDGKLFVIGELPFEDYLKGIAEVPRLWPTAALKAQVVAARSYALANMAYPDSTGDRLGYDLCATTSCQVFVGMGISGGPYGDRWIDAVDDTAGKVLLYRKKPADTLYFSTSNGSTLGNQEVFGTDPLPYLQPVEEKDDAASPVRDWTSTISLDDVGTFLVAAGDRTATKAANVTRTGDNVLITGGGEKTTLSVADFRTHINYWSHCLDPNSYPGTNGSNGTGLPQTIPSIWFSMARSDNAIDITGEGWGHGVGMVQWGAYGKAKRGVGYKDILADYYGGLKPKSYDEPATIRIGIAVGLTTVRVEGSGLVTASGTDLTTGPWRLDGGNKVHVKTGSPIPQPIPKATLDAAPSTAHVGKRLNLAVTVPELSVVSAVFEGPEGDVPVADPVTLQAGKQGLSGTVPDLPPDDYRLVVVVTDGVDVSRTNGPKIPVVGGTVPSPSPSVTTASPSPSASSTSVPTVQAAPPPSSGVGWVLPVAVIAGGAVLALVVGLLAAVRRRRHREETGSWGAA
jgi:stage II sporulation protein D